MAKLDEAKERLGLLKFWLGAFVACFVGIGAWCATNYKLLAMRICFLFYQLWLKLCFFI